MQHRRFFIPQSIQDNTVTVTDERLLHKWRKVLRAGEGYELTLFDGSGWEYQGRVAEIAPDHATVTVTDTRAVESVRPAVWLYVGMIKRDKFEWALEKATELGVAGVVPLTADRSQKTDLKYDRARKIIIEAAEQSGRAWLPEIGEMKPVQDALDDVDPSVTRVLDAGGDGAADALHAHAILNFFVGPEGGWSDRERDLFQNKGIQSVSLGKQNLKTETAVVVAGAQVLLR